MNKHHPYHMVNKSPWPLTGSISCMTTALGMILWLHKNNMSLYMTSTIALSMTLMQWWRDIARESTYQGNHTPKVMNGIKWGMILFIASEILFFSSMFWAFLHSSLSPSTEIGMSWPPKGIKSPNPMHMPLLNTVVLLYSGMTVTWAHKSLLKSNHKQTTFGQFMEHMSIYSCGECFYLTLHYL